MSMIFIGYKCGMTSFFSSEGFHYPVSVVKLYTNYIVDIKALNDSISLVKVSACFLNEKKASKSISGFYKKLGLSCLKYMTEFSVFSDKISCYSIGDALPLSLFNVLDKVDVIGVSKGRGFTGVIKRHNFKSQGASHGNSLSHRVPGSIGQCQTPGRVFKGKKMPGRMGNCRVTTKNINIMNIYTDLNIVVLKGAIPGHIGNKIMLRKNF